MRIILQSDQVGFETLENFASAPAFNRWLYNKIKNEAFGQILEIGCGIGNISAFFLEDQNNISLSDLRPEYCRYIDKKFGGHPHLRGIYELDLSRVDFEEKYGNLLESFDTVIALNVIEHLENDLLAIRNAGKLLRNNGKLVVLVPAGQCLYNSLDRALGHYRRYSKTQLNKLLESTGLAINSGRYFNAAAVGGWWFSGNILKDKIISPSKLNLYNQLVPFFRIVDWFAAPFMGLSVISVGIKNSN